MKTEIRIHKVDETNHSIALQGAAFTMYADQECTKEIAKATTDQLGNAVFKNLSFGTTVYIKETKAPIGYELSDTIIKVTINDEWFNKDTRDRVLTITNHKIPNTPNTGDHTNASAYLILTFITALIMTITQRNIKQRDKTIKNQ